VPIGCNSILLETAFQVTINICEIVILAKFIQKLATSTSGITAGWYGGQAAFLRDREQLTRTEEDEYEAAVADATFRLHVLEMRLKRHEQRAGIKFQELEGCLTSDPRLAAALALAPAA
jgi:hypothetical protein